MKTTNNEPVPLLVTTAHRGVFFGYGRVTTEKIIRLERARMAVYWSTECKGVLGLAVTGPSSSCRIGLSVPAITLQDVVSITEVSPEGPANGGKGGSRKVGQIEQITGPLEICTRKALHGTHDPCKWKGGRWWIVRLKEPVQTQGDKVASLEREIVADLGPCPFPTK